MGYQKKYSNGPSDRGGFNRGGGFQSRGENFRATCADCGNDCTVPFKPNGRKPVLCSDCFQGGDQGGGRRFDSFDNRPPRRSFDKPRFSEKPNNEGIEKELKQIRQKLERILNILQETDVEEVE